MITTLLFVLSFHHVVRPKYDKAADRWTCQANRTAYADQDQALAGKRFVHCVK